MLLNFGKCDESSRPDTFFIGLYNEDLSTFNIGLLCDELIIVIAVFVTGNKTNADDFRNLSASRLVFEEVKAEEAEDFRNFGLLLSHDPGICRRFALFSLARLFHKPIKSEVFPRDTFFTDIFGLMCGTLLNNNLQKIFVQHLSQHRSSREL